MSSEQLAGRVVVIAQLAEELDRNTLELALRIVPLEWWQERLSVAVPSEDPSPVATTRAGRIDAS
jgi:hypothetical protein